MALKENILDRAQKYIAKGYFDKAVAEYRAAIELDPKDISIRLRLGDLFVKLGNKAEAIKEYMEAAKANAQRGFNLKAIAVFKQVLKLDEANLDVHNRLAELYAKQRLIVDAISEYTYIMGAFEKKGKTNEVIELLKKMTDIDPENAGIRLKLAEYYQRLGFDKDALAEYCGVFDKLFSQNKFDKAEKVILGLFSRYPGEAQALVRIARLYKTRSDSSQFIRYSEMLLDYYKNVEDEDGARAVCAEILESAPDHREGLKFMERFSPKQPEPPRGAASYQEVIAEEKAPPLAAPPAEEPQPLAAEEPEESAPLIEFPEEASAPPVFAAPLPRSADALAAVQSAREEAEIEISLEGFEETMAAQPAHLEESAPAEAGPEETNIEIKLEMEEAPVANVPQSAFAEEKEVKDTVRMLETPTEAGAEIDVGTALEAAVREARFIEEALPAEAPIPEEAALPPRPQEPKEEEFAEKEAEEALLAIEAMQAEEALKEEAAPESPPIETVKEDAVKEEATPLLKEVLLMPTEEATEAEAIIEIQEEMQEAAAKEAEEKTVAIEEHAADERLEEAVAPPVAEEQIRLEAEAVATEENEAPEPLRAPPLHEDRIEKDISEAITELMEKMEPPAPLLNVFPEKVIEDAGTERKEDEFVDLSAELGIEGGVEGFTRPQPKPLDAADELLSGIEKQLGREDTETHYNLGIAYMEMELYKEASNEFKVGLRDARLAFDCYMRLGLCAMAQSSPDEAIIYYLKALQIDSKTHEDIMDLKYRPSTGKEKLQFKSSMSRRKGIMYELGLAYEAAAGYEEAAEVFKAIYDIDPDFRDVGSKVQASAHSGEFTPADDDMIEVELL
ncbi:MAG: tetratricopeptide repeat protein [Deltaproteobacteria bacterium]|nr:tetratricopeptide repeat protein [Deltaproteobacteria bacterium]